MIFLLLYMSIIIMPYQPPFYELRPCLHSSPLDAVYIPSQPPMILPSAWRALLTEILVKTRHIHNNVHGDNELEREIAMYKIQDTKTLKLTCKEKGLLVSGSRWQLIARIMAFAMYGLRIGNWDKVRHTMHQKLFDLSVMVAFYTENGHSYARNTGGSDGTASHLALASPWNTKNTGVERKYGLRIGNWDKSYIRYYCGNKLDPTIMDRKGMTNRRSPHWR